MASLLLLISTSLQANIVYADDNQTYTKQFKDEITTLSGKSVESSMYFTKMDYWNIDKMTFNFNYQVSQLTTTQTSDITLSLNGTKFYSFRPKVDSGFQTEHIEIPLDLISENNKLQITGQILNYDQNSGYRLHQTPANWLTIGKGSNVNFEYQLKEPDNSLSSFYEHFSGQDNISTSNSKIITSNEPSGDELTASMIALSGESRAVQTESDQIPVIKMDQMKPKKGNYLMVVATYEKLPKKLRSQIDLTEVKNRAIIKTYYDNGKYYLIVTGTDGKLLKKAARFVANEELMKEANRNTEDIVEDTNTFTSSLHDDGIHYLTDHVDRVEGVGHKENSYLVKLPNDRSNSDGSEIKLNFNYSKNLDFNRSLVTVFINNTIIGSKKLSEVNANSDSLSLKFPKGLSLGSNFTVRVAFDLEMKNQDNSDNSNTPWAQIDPQSKMLVKSERSNDLLFSNYPAMFIKNETFDNISVVIPKKLNDDDFKSLTNIFNLIGSFAKGNSGNIQFYQKIPSDKILKNSNVIVVGTPDNNPLIKKLNSDLYFKYSKNFKGFESNEKLSIGSNYGQNIGTSQLLRSPFNEKRGMLVITGKTSNDIFLATTQINFQKNIKQFNGDAIVVDINNNHSGYRFKKNSAIDKQLANSRTLSKNSQLITYLTLAVAVMLIIGGSIFILIRKHMMDNNGGKNVK